MPEHLTTNVPTTNRRTFIGVSDARIIRGEVERNDLSGNLIAPGPVRARHAAGPAGATTLDGAKIFVNPVRAAHAEFVATLVRHPPWPIPIDTHAIDIEARADHLKALLTALSAYLTAILDDTAQNVPGSLDLRQIDALLSDLASDVSGTLQHAIEAVSERFA